MSDLHLRDQIAKAMFAADSWHPDLWDAPNGEWTADYRRRADAALPLVVAEVIRQMHRTADDFEATDLEGPWSGGDVAYELRARANVLDWPDGAETLP